MNNLNSILLNTDSYKVSMWKQYPPGTEYVYSYIESRGGRYDRTLFFGLQAFIREYLMKPITQEDIDVADKIWTAHGEPFNREGWEYILKTYEGYLPIEIRAVPEGTVIPTKNVLVTVENTDPKVPWLTTWVETSILRAVWYPTTVATQSYEIKQLIKSYLEKTGDPAGLPFKLHDFGARGVSSFESAELGGAAHLINFMGTDTMSGIIGAMKYYDADVCGFSIPAAEHSTITSWGRENEAKAYENMLNQFAKPGAILAVVSDSYDVFNAVKNLWGEELKQKVIDSGATVVIRPDSGNPEHVCSVLVQLLDRKFGSTVNEKGFRVLNNVRMIQGDGINYRTIDAILSNFMVHGYSADNIAFGMGGALLQGIDRDTQKFAMKCSAIRVNGVWRDVQKDPITDPGKKSKVGRITLWKDGDSYITDRENSYFGILPVLQTVFENGEMCNPINFEQIRENSNL